MLDKDRSLRGVVVPLALALGVASAAMAAGQAGSTSEPLRCEIEATSQNGMIALKGVVHADTEISGSYRLEVVSTGRSGGANIRQSGDFTAGPDRAATLGEIMLGGAGAVYDATLEITSNGTVVECAKRVGGTI